MYDDDELILGNVERLPATLYRYAGVEGKRLSWLRDVIVDSRLYFSSPSQFNDPLDCRIPPEFHAPALVKDQYWRRDIAAREMPPGWTKHHTKRRILELSQQTLTPAGREKLIAEVFKVIDGTGMVCLSSDPANMLMWSYYAAGHTGVALRFSTDAWLLANLPAKAMPLEVRYQEDFPAVNFFLDSPKKRVMTILGTKAKAWEHEKEWRLVLSRRVGMVQIPPEMVTGVVFGLRVAPETEATIRGWLDERTGPPLELQRVVHKPRSFVLELSQA